MGELVKVDIAGAVAQVTITREKALNALNNDVLGELIEAVTQLDGTAGVRAVILTGAGEKAFVAGADIAQMVEMPVEDAERFSTRAGALGRAIERSRLVWIAAVNGFALGGGCELAMICDFIYASDKARFGQPEVKLGVIPGFGGTQRLTRRVGVGKAKELCVTGDMIDATEALRIGLCDKVVPHAELLDTARAAAERISKNGPQAVAETKRIILQGNSMPLDEALALETRVFAGLFETSDQREGMAAFLAKRPANFGGK